MEHSNYKNKTNTELDKKMSDNVQIQNNQIESDMQSIKSGYSRQGRMIDAIRKQS